MDFKTFKKSSSMMDRLKKEIESINNPPKENFTDERTWYPELDKAGNGQATIRFLPSPAVDVALDKDALPWCRIFVHSFKGPTGKWYINNSLTSLGRRVKDPVSEFNSKLWNEVDDDNSPQRKQARNQKRKLRYYSNILMVSDPKHPENEGKIFLFGYGKKIFDKISVAMNPEFEGDEKVNVFDFFEGANFRLRVRKVEGYPNYDLSTFEAKKPLSTDDVYLEQIWRNSYSLVEFLDPKNFKSYDELKKQLEDVLEIQLDQKPLTLVEKKTPKPILAAAEPEDDTPPWSDVDDDPDVKNFRSMAQ